MTPYCAAAGPALAYLGWHGTVHIFDVLGRPFALGLMQANRKKLAHLDPAAHAFLQASEHEAWAASNRAAPAPNIERSAATEAAWVRQPPPGRPAPAPAPQEQRSEWAGATPSQPSRGPNQWPQAPAAHLLARGAPQPAAHVPARFLSQDEPLTVAGRTIHRPLTYVSEAPAQGTDASTIVTRLAVGNAANALPLPYWPSYLGADPDQRARYLDWMAEGRIDPEIPVGYPFIFFYGLERRVLVDGADEELVRAEVARLLALYGHSRSFSRYASEFLAFAPLRHAAHLSEMSEEAAEQMFAGATEQSATALAALAAWYHLHHAPVPSRHAASLARSRDEAKRSTLVQRAPGELLDLFAIRYRDAFGAGVVLEATKRPLAIEYRTASGTLLHTGFKATLPNVLGKVGQFRPLVTLWNRCIEDLRSAGKRKGDRKALTAEAWSALPAELRAEYDHPDQDKWDMLMAAAPRLATFHLVEVSQLAGAMGVGQNAKLSAAQMRKVAERAADVGYAIEPDARVCGKGAGWGDEVLAWRATYPACDTKLYGAVSAMVTLAMSIAMADTILADEEQVVINSFVGEMFALDDQMRLRVDAMKYLLARHPIRVGTIASTLRANRSAKELAKVGRVLVAVSAADGTIAESEHKALRTLYRSLGLSTTDLAAAIAATGARLERDGLVEVQSAIPGPRGEAIPPPPDRAPAARLDQAAIDAILADTRDVAAMLADVLDAESEPESTSGAAPPSDVGVRDRAAPRASAEVAAIAGGLDVRYHAVLEDLLGRAVWPPDEVRTLSAKHRLMPGAILDAINTWSDEALGDFMIQDDGDWHVNVELARISA